MVNEVVLRERTSFASIRSTNTGNCSCDVSDRDIEIGEIFYQMVDEQSESAFSEAPLEDTVTNIL